jgi:hypothetical protein
MVIKIIYANIKIMWIGSIGIKWSTGALESKCMS